MRKSLTCRVYLIAVLYSLILHNSFASMNDGSRVIRIGAFNYPPAIFKDTDGKIKGFYTEILAEIAKQERWHIEYDFSNWDDGLKKAQSKQVDLLTSVAYTAERSTYLDYGKVPILTVWSEVYSLPASEINGLLDLKKKKIGIMKGDVNGKNLIGLTSKLGVTPEYIEFADFESVMESVSSRKIDAGVVSSTVGTGKARKYGLKSTGIVFDPFDIYFAVPKGTNISLIRTLDEYLERWKTQEDSPYYIAREHWEHLFDRQVVLIPRWVTFTITGLLFGIIAAIGIVFLFRRKIVITQNKLILNKRQYQDIFEHSPVAIWLEDFSSVKNELDRLRTEGVKDLAAYLKNNPQFTKKCVSLIRVIDINRSACQLQGVDSKNDLMNALKVSFTDKGLEAAELSLITIWDGKCEFETNSTVKGPGNKVIEVIMRWRVGTGCEHDYSQIYLTLVDITALKDTQRELLNQTNKLSVTLSCITDAVITIGLQGEVISMNPKAREITGWGEESFQNFSIDTWYEQSTFRIAPGALNPVRALLLNKPVPVQDAIIRFRSPVGEELRLEHICTPIRDDTGTLIGVILLFRDLTQFHKMMEQVQKTDKLEALGVLAGGIAHDFNNLLGGLFGYIDMAVSVSTDPETNNYLQKAGKVFDRAKNLTNQLLTFTKSGLPDRKTGPVAPVVVDAVNFALSGKDIVRKFDVSNDLLNCDFDANQIAQVIDNICINAAHAMNGTGLLHVKMTNCTLKTNEIEDLPSGSYVLIEISDTGPGISSEIIKRVFDPFFTTKVQGSGLGLATSFSIIRRHDGMIIAESPEGAGATFKIYLPASNEKEIISLSNDREHTGSGVIIIMDDEGYIRDVVANYVKKMEYSPIVTNCGEDALESVKKCIENNTVIRGFLLDLTVPGCMGGIQCIQKIREIYKDGFAIAMSGYSQDEVMEFPAKYGFTTSIKKPFRKRDLYQVFNRCVMEEGKGEKISV